MDYKKLAADLLSGCEENCADCEYAGDSELECTIAQLAATAITDLLARAEAAEARCAALDGVVSEYQEEIIPGFRKLAEKAEARVKKLSEALEREKRRAEKAERERDAAVSDLETIMAYGEACLDTCEFCKNAQCYARGGTKPCLPKWRGQKGE